jgi:hypothetical protein
VSCNEIVFYCRNASHEDDEYEAMKATEAKNYYALAHTVREDINDQASSFIFIIFMRSISTVENNFITTHMYILGLSWS